MPVKGGPFGEIRPRRQVRPHDDHNELAQQKVADEEANENPGVRYPRAAPNGSSGAVMIDGTVIAISGDWSVTTDGLQWILRRRVGTDRRTGKPVWESVSFVRSTKDILALCMREKGTPPEDARKLLAGLGERFSPTKLVNAENALPKDGQSYFIMLHARA